MAETQHNSSSWQVNFLISITFCVLLLTFGVVRSQAIYQANENYHEPLSYGYGHADASNQLQQPNDELPDKFFDVEVSKKDGVDGKEFFPLLMPKVHPTEEESYLCTPIEIKDKEYYITGKLVYKEHRKINKKQQRYYGIVYENFAI